MNFRKLPDVLSDDERQRLLKQFNLRYPSCFRNYCMVRLMIDCGLRISEVLNICSLNIDWISGKLTIKEGKGKKDRIVWVSDELLEYLREWKDKSKNYARVANGTNSLFVTLKGSNIYTCYVREMLKRVSKKAGILKHVYPHLLRHTFATDLYRKTKNIRMVQKTLGHSNLSTTMIYTHIFDEDLEKEIKNLR